MNTNFSPLVETAEAEVADLQQIDNTTDMEVSAEQQTPPCLDCYGANPCVTFVGDGFYCERDTCRHPKARHVAP